jgi:hypothetical protein
VTVNRQLGEFSAAVAFLGGATSAITPTADALRLQRFSHSRTFSSATAAYAAETIFFGYSNGAAVDLTIRIGLPQLEQGAFATSVILTSAAAATRAADVSTSAAATRSADVASITGSAFSSWYRQDAQTWFGEYAPIYTASATVPANTPHLLQVYNNAVVANNYAVRGVEASTSQLCVARNPTTGSQFPGVVTGFGIAGAYRKVSYAIDSSFLSVSVNGIGPSTTANNVAALMATHDILSIGSGTGGAPPYQTNGTIRRLCYWNQRLANSTLQSITS